MYMYMHGYKFTILCAFTFLITDSVCLLLAKGNASCAKGKLQNSLYK